MTDQTQQAQQRTGTKQIAQVLQGFNYEGEFITPFTARETIDAIPRDVMQQHVDTGFARWVETPDTAPANGAQ